MSDNKSNDKTTTSSGKHSSRPVSPLTGYPSGYIVLPLKMLPDPKTLKKRLYKHTRCDQMTRPPDDLLGTLEVDPLFYNELYCQACRRYAPCGEEGEFVWLADGKKVGSVNS